MLKIGDWRVDARTGEIARLDQRERLEPRTMALLMLFARHPGAVLTREYLLAQVWPDVIVGEDALARSLFKLRKALGDDAKAPVHIETLPKRGYRLIASVQAAPSAIYASAQVDSPADALPSSKRTVGTTRWRGVLTATAVSLSVSALVVFWRDAPPKNAPTEVLEQRAVDFYGNYSRADNEAAIALYERILAADADRVSALAGLASALTQRVMRWPQVPESAPKSAPDSEPVQQPSYTNLSDALRAGHMQSAQAQKVLARAKLLAERALALEPKHTLALRSLGLVLSAQGQLVAALSQYDTALAVDADAWGVLINRSEVLSLLGRETAALDSLVAAFAAMTRRYQADRMQIQPWYAELAVLIGQRLEAQDRSIESEAWYRRALTHTPLHAQATGALAKLLRKSGREPESRALCQELLERIGENPDCARLLANSP